MTQPIESNKYFYEFDELDDMNFSMRITSKKYFLKLQI